MSKKKKKIQHQQVQLVTINDATTLLRLSAPFMDSLISQGVCRPQLTKTGHFGITLSEFRMLAHRDDVKAGVVEAMTYEARRRETDDSNGPSDRFLIEIKEAVANYRNHIQILQEIHAHYKNQFDLLHEESGLVAAYMIYAKVIRLLNMACLCLEHGFWDTLILLRPIDEAMQLAKYFSRCEGTEACAKTIETWFRENRSPKNELVRESLGANLDQLQGEQGQRPMASLYSELYQKKSSEIHHTLGGMWETLPTRVEKGTLVFSGFDYGPCTYPRKLNDITILFRSSIWSSIQSFLLCFQERIQLEDQHIHKLREIDDLFLRSC
jgi:hypothetical protein